LIKKRDEVGKEGENKININKKPEVTFTQNKTTILLASSSG